MVVYIKEAHPEDEWQMAVNERQDVVFKQPKTYEERQHIASLMVEAFDIKIPTVIDKMDNSCQIAYSAWPERYYLVDKQGKIAYKGKPGPRGFRPDEFRAFLTDRYLAQAKPQNEVAPRNQ